MATSKNKLQLELLGDSGELKVYQATADTEILLNDHISTGDAVVIVEEGSCKIQMGDDLKELTKGGFAIIPKNQLHSLKADSAFRAKIAVSNTAEIKSHQKS